MSKVHAPCPSARRIRRGSWFLSLALAWILVHAAPVRAQAPLPPGLSPPAKPTAMPTFELPTVGGTALRSEALRGQVVVIRFWASW